MTKIDNSNRSKRLDHRVEYESLDNTAARDAAASLISAEAGPIQRIIPEERRRH
jgi:hypothetical protein